MRLLIVDDDPQSASSLKKFLEREAFAVDHVSAPRQGSYLSRINGYDLILIHQKFESGFGTGLCAEIRASGKHVPIIGMLSVRELEPRLQFFSAGADDCIVKPCALQELILRIRAVLRRGATLKFDVLKAAGVTLDCRTQRVLSGRKVVPLSKKEFSLLEILMRNKGAIVPRMVLLEHVWDMNSDPLSNSLEAHVFSLRKKLGNRGRAAIRNVQGRGYLFEE